MPLPLIQKKLSWATLQSLHAWGTGCTSLALQLLPFLSSQARKQPLITDLINSGKAPCSQTEQVTHCLLADSLKSFSIPTSSQVTRGQVQGSRLQGGKDLSCPEGRSPFQHLGLPGSVEPPLRKVTSQCEQSSPGMRLGEPSEPQRPSGSGCAQRAA